MARDVVLKTSVAAFSDEKRLRDLIDSLIAQCGRSGSAAFGSLYVPETSTLHILCSRDGRVASHAITPLSDLEALSIYRRVITEPPLDLRTESVASAVDAVIGVQWATVQ